MNFPAEIYSRRENIKAGNLSCLILSVPQIDWNTEKLTGRWLITMTVTENGKRLTPLGWSGKSPSDCVRYLKRHADYCDEASNSYGNTACLEFWAAVRAVVDTLPGVSA